MLRIVASAYDPQLKRAINEISTLRNEICHNYVTETHHFTTQPPNYLSMSSSQMRAFQNNVHIFRQFMNRNFPSIEILPIEKSPDLCFLDLVQNNIYINH